MKKVILAIIVFNLFLGASAKAETGFGLFKPQGSITTPNPVTSSQLSGFALFKSLQSGSTATNFNQSAEQSFSINPEQAASGTEFSLSASFSLSATNAALSSPSTLKLAAISDKVDLPWNLHKISSVFSYQLTPIASPAKPLTVTLSYTKGNNEFKQIYFFDPVKKNWLALPSTDYPAESKVRAVISRPGALLAIFSKPDTLTVGRASWYKYKGGDFAASPDFPKGSKLRVTNLANNKSVEIIVNDWGPERDKHPDRAIDLDKIAFAKIASTGEGVINVSVSPIEIAASSDGRVLGVKAEALGVEPKIASQSLLVMNENTGDTVLEKGSATVRSIASLSKIVAMSVYLSLKPNLDDIVTYKQADEDLNHLYCKPWENTKVKLSDGMKLPARDLFNSALVGSANNAVETLVRSSGLSREAFIAKMNETVTAWGATNTKFIEPTGLSSKNVSSAKDYALITREAAKNKELATTSIKPSYVFTDPKKIKHTIRNTNKLIVEQAQLNLRAPQYPIISSKTGYLDEAGYCLVTRVKQGADNYTIVTLNAPTREASFMDMADLINYLKFKMI